MSATYLVPIPIDVVVSSPPHISDDDSDANSTPPATPIFQPSPLHLDPTVLIEITSYAHTPPLQPPPDLQYDLRTFPSPSPEKYASKSDGRGSRVREWVNTEAAYIQLLKQVEEEALKKGRELEAEKEIEERENADKLIAQSTENDAEPTSAITQSTESEKELVERIDALNLEPTQAQHAKGLLPPKILRIGVSSEMGRDRSVAFVEELSRKKWPVEWAVEVLHRDVAKQQRNPRKGKARGGEKGGRRKNLKDYYSANEE